MWHKPIVEIRVEEYQRGVLPRLSTVFREHAVSALRRHVGAPLAFYVPNVGRINCITQLWAYDSMADYETRQAALAADPSWHAYLQAAEGMIRYRDSRLTRRIVFPALEATSPSVSKPVVDFRTYLMHFDKMPVFLETTERFAMEVMLRHIGPPVGYYQTMIGNLQQITHIWGYDSMADMETRRRARNADPDWVHYLDASHGIYERQETQILQKLDLFDRGETGPRWRDVA